MLIEQLDLNRQRSWFLKNGPLQARFWKAPLTLSLGVSATTLRRLRRAGSASSAFSIAWSREQLLNTINLIEWSAEEVALFRTLSLIAKLRILEQLPEHMSSRLCGFFRSAYFRWSWSHCNRLQPLSAAKQCGLSFSRLSFLWFPRLQRPSFKGIRYFDYDSLPKSRISKLINCNP